MNQDLISLDDLFKEVKRTARVMKAAKVEAPLPDPRAIYTNPENWTRTRGIALIHVDTETLLGNFSEYVHKSIAACRRLVREDAPLLVSATERVTGGWWIGESGTQPEAAAEWHSRHELILHIQLERLGVHAPNCSIITHVSYGAITRVELASDTTFAQMQGAEQLLFLPARTNILLELPFDLKVAIRKELAL